MAPVRPLWLRLLHAERGVLLWLPALWAAAALVLFGIVQAGTERSHYNHTLDLRLALGPVDWTAADADRGQAFAAALRQALVAQRELTLVQDEVIRRRVESLLGVPPPEEPRLWMRATRNLNVSVYLTARLWDVEDRLHASVALWSVGTEEEFARFSTGGEGAPFLAQALADSVGRALFTPQGRQHAAR